MLKKWKMSTTAIILVLMLLTLSACQAVGGFDVNKAILSSISPNSFESSQTLSIEVVPSGKATSIEDQKIIDLLNSFSVILDEIKLQDQSTASIKGSVSYLENKLPFILAVDKKSLSLWVEGAKQPLYISLEDQLAGGSFSSLITNNLSLTEETKGLQEQVISLLLKHAPNPSNISVTPAKETVNGEEVNLQKLHIEIRGDELFPLFKTFLSGIVKDEATVKQVIGAFYDLILTANEQNQDIASIWGEETIPSREEAINEAWNEMQSEIDELLADYDENLKELLLNSPELNSIFGKDTVLKLDYYLDNKLNIRKQNLELVLQLPEGDDIPVKSIKLKTQSDFWNVNGDVKAEEVQTKGLNVLSNKLTPGNFLRNFDNNSTIYKVLREDLKVSSKYAVLSNQFGEYKPLVQNNTTYVPLRYFASEFDAKVSYTPDTQKVTIIDDITGSVIDFKIGSKSVKIDGKSAPSLTHPIFVHKGTTYVPLRYIAEHLGAKLKLEDGGWIYITRD